MSQGLAYALAAAIYTGSSAPHLDVDDLADRMRRTLSVGIYATDEFQADLYAQLIECAEQGRLTDSTTFKDAVDIIEDCINSTEENWRG
jgi:hypothetical protein